MRGFQTVLLLCILCLSVSQAQRPSSGDEDEDRVEIPRFSASVTSSRTTIASRTISRTPTAFLSIPVATSQTTGVPFTSSLVSEKENFQSTSSFSSVQSSNTLADGIISTGLPSSNSTATSPQRELIIILSSVLGSIGILLAVLVLFLVCRYRKRRTVRRGVSPIDDEEIESWRNAERKQSNASDQASNNGAIGLAISPSPPSILKTPPRAALARSASFQAKAPNSRIGLTDEAIPGQAPFIPTIKRQESRLSKTPPGHSRKKSSTSMRSIHTRSFINDDEGLPDRGTPWTYSGYASTNGSRSQAPTWGINSTPPTSEYGGGPNEPGGLSPRPRQNTREHLPPLSADIGRGW